MLPGMRCDLAASQSRWLIRGIFAREAQPEPARPTGFGDRFLRWSVEGTGPGRSGRQARFLDGPMGIFRGCMRHQESSLPADRSRSLRHAMQPGPTALEIARSLQAVRQVAIDLRTG